MSRVTLAIWRENKKARHNFVDVGGQSSLLDFGADLDRQSRNYIYKLGFSRYPVPVSGLSFSLYSHDLPVLPSAYFLSLLPTLS